MLIISIWNMNTNIKITNIDINTLWKYIHICLKNKIYLSTYKWTSYIDTYWYKLLVFKTRIYTCWPLSWWGGWRSSNPNVYPSPRKHCSYLVPFLKKSHTHTHKPLKQSHPAVLTELFAAYFFGGNCFTTKLMLLWYDTNYCISDSELSNAAQ